MISRAKARVAIVGVGGLGAPVAMALSRAKVGALILIDDDVVDRTNLHRQILYRDADVGRHKLEAARDAIARISETRVELRRGLLHPGSTSLLDDADVIVECSDRYAVKFLAADVARLTERPIVHGAAIRWVGTAMASGPRGGPCYRCLFEDAPEGAQQSCDVAGVIGPVCGIVGAVQAHFTLKILDGNASAVFGTIASFGGRTDTLRLRTAARRASCPLCGTSPTIDRIEPTRYASPPPCDLS